MFERSILGISMQEDSRQHLVGNAKTFVENRGNQFTNSEVNDFGGPRSLMKSLQNRIQETLKQVRNHTKTIFSQLKSISQTGGLFAAPKITQKLTLIP